MWSWGTANQGQCGTADGSAKPLLSPTPASTSELQAKVVAVAAGEAHCMAQDELGNCYVWGRTREGQAGRVGPVAQMTPMLVKPLQHETVTRVACGSHTCYAVTATGRCYVWGSVLVETGESLHNDAAGYGRSFAQLSEGAQRMVRQSVSDYITCTDSRRSFLNEDGTDATAASASVEGAAAAADDGPEALPEFRRVAQPEPLPLPLPAGVRVRRVASGFSFCVLLLEGGGALASGFNDRFQLGLGDRQMRGAPTPIRELRGVPLVEVACGQQHTVALGRDGRAYSWGLGSFGQLGHGSHADEPRPRRIDALEAMGRCVAVACGHLHTALLLMPQQSSGGAGGGGGGGGGGAAQTEAAATAVGEEVVVEAGASEGAAERPYIVRSRGGEPSAAASTPASAPGSASTSASASAALYGSASTSASASAALYGFGHAEFGQLGTGDMGSAGEAKRDFSLPRLVPLPRAVSPRAVACGALHTCVLARSGQLLTFGWGSAGALGHGSTGYVLAPTVVGALRGHRIRAVAAGSRHVTALEDEPDSDAMHTEALAACARRLRLPRLAALCEGRLRGQRDELSAPTVVVAPGRRLVEVGHHSWRDGQGAEGDDAAGMDAAAEQDERVGEGEGEGEDDEAGGPPGTLGGDLARLLESGHCADVTLRATDGATVRASRLLLCARSEYFRTCLSGDSAFAEATAQQRDKGSGDVLLDLSAYGLAAADLRALLQFLYAGRLRGAAVATAAAAAVAAEEEAAPPAPAAPAAAVAAVATEEAVEEANEQPEHEVEEGNLDSELLGTLRAVPPQLALTLLRAATALLLDDLKVLCEAVLVRYLDADNCAALAEVAESCFAPRLHGKCVALLERVGGGGST